VGSICSIAIRAARAFPTFGPAGPPGVGAPTLGSCGAPSATCGGIFACCHATNELGRKKGRLAIIARVILVGTTRKRVLFLTQAMRRAAWLLWCGFQLVFGTIFRGNYTNPEPGDFRLSWALDDVSNLITFNMEFDIRGWIAIGWSSTYTDHEVFLDFYAAVFNDTSSQWRIVDGNAKGRSTINVDATNNIMNGSATRLGATTSFSFTRQLNTGDTAGDALVSTGTTYLLWCYHVDDAGFDSRMKHDYYGKTSVDWYAGPLEVGSNIGPKRSLTVHCGYVQIAMYRVFDYAGVQGFYKNILAATGIPAWRLVIFEVSDFLHNLTVTPLVSHCSSLDGCRGSFITLFTLPNYRNDANENGRDEAQLAQAVSAAVATMPRSTSLAILGRPADVGNGSQSLSACYDEQNVIYYWPGTPCPVPTAGGGVFQSPKGDFSLRWTVVPGKPSGTGVISFVMKASTQGWVGVCLSDVQNHHRSGSVDCYVGYFSGATLNFQDYTARDHNTVPSVDPKSSILASSGSVENGVTTIKFSRQLNSGVAGDVNLDQSMDFNLLWAHHPTAADFGAARVHDNFGAARVNFVSGALSELPWYEHMALGWGVTDMDAGFLSSMFVAASFFILGVLRHTKKLIKRACGRDLRSHRRFDNARKAQTEMAEVQEAYGDHQQGGGVKQDTAWYGKGASNFDEITNVVRDGLGDEAEAKETWEEKHGKQNSGFTAVLQGWFQLRLFGTHTPWEILTCALFITMNFFCILVSTVDLAANLGYLAAANSLFIILPANRNSFLVIILAIPFDKVIFYHRMLGYWLFILVWSHGLLYFPRWMSNDTFGGAIAYSWGDPKVVWGNLGGIASAFILCTSLGFIRRNKYEVFYYLHFAFFAYYLFGSLHSPRMMAFYAVVAASLWGLDRLVRFSTGITHQKTLSLTPKDGGIVAIRFRKNKLQDFFGAYKVGQYVFVNLPEVNRLQWHPFSITSGPLDDFVEIHVRGLGDFTKEVLVHASKPGASLTIRADGPYGNPHPVTHLRFPVLIFVGGGIGIAPIISYIRDIYDGTRAHCIKNVYVIWSVPVADNVGWFSSVFQEYLLRSKNNRALPSLDVRVFVTKEPEVRNVKDAGFTVMPGYPDFNMLLNLCLKGQQKKVATMLFSCGPAAMVENAWDASNRLRREGYSIAFKHEVFEW